MPEIISSYLPNLFQNKTAIQERKIYFHNLFTFRRKKNKITWFSLPIIVSSAVSVLLLVFDVKGF